MLEQSATRKEQPSEIDTAKIRQEVADLLTPNPAIYWLDFLASVGLGWGAFLLALPLPFDSLVYWACMGVSALALYRAVSFTHELVHLRKSAVPGFYSAWTLLCGAPLLVPNFLYAGIHIAHHAKTKYGTSIDGEYLPFASSTPWLIVRHFLSNLILPVFAILRFAVVGPASFLSPKLRHLVVERLSAMSLQFPFQREIASPVDERLLWLKEEVLTSAILWLVLGGVLAGWLPVKVFAQYGVVIILIATLNSIRALGATHRYLSRGVEISLRDQVLDSVNLQSHRVDALLFCPVGLRYHALHHAVPTLPYHALGEAHRRLSKTLPSSAEYHHLAIRSIWQGWSDLFANIRRSGVAS